MHTIKSLQQLIEKEMLQLQLGNEPAALYEPMRYMLALGGKRMRPVLTLMGCQLFGGKIEQSLPAALGLEVFHNFTLLHDDVMDNAPLRRASTTVHNKWNSNIAILSGDAMFVKSCQLMMQVEDQKIRSVMELFMHTALQVCEGQQWDMDFEKQNDVSIARYLKMIELKTAVLLGCCLKVGAMTADAGEVDATHIYEFGKNIGIAFQLQDDLLDVYGDSEKFGKLSGGDILADKKTFLLLKAQELASRTQQLVLKRWIHTAQKGKEQEKIDAIKNLYDELDVQKHAETEMDFYYHTALEHLKAINIPLEQKSNLSEFAMQLMVRQV